jgi:hypothetical protein
VGSKGLRAKPGFFWLSEGNCGIIWLWPDYAEGLRSRALARGVFIANCPFCYYKISVKSRRKDKDLITGQAKKLIKYIRKKGKVLKELFIVQ